MPTLQLSLSPEYQHSLHSCNGYSPDSVHVCTCRQNSDSSDGSVEPSKQREGIPDSLPASQADTDWREFRARLIASQNASTSAKSGTQEAVKEVRP